jgi:hypothetical protein
MEVHEIKIALSEEELKIIQSALLCYRVWMKNVTEGVEHEFFVNEMNQTSSIYEKIRKYQ